MAAITIDNIEYDTDILSAEAKNQLQSIQFVDSELAITIGVRPQLTGQVP